MHIFTLQKGDYKVALLTSENNDDIKSPLFSPTLTLCIYPKNPNPSLVDPPVYPADSQLELPAPLHR
jgi:hypothetical protein